MTEAYSRKTPPEPSFACKATETAVTGREATDEYLHGLTCPGPLQARFGPSRGLFFYGCKKTQANPVFRPHKPAPQRSQGRHAVQQRGLAEVQDTQVPSERAGESIKPQTI